jgi:hypothetical protein
MESQTITPAPDLLDPEVIQSMVEAEYVRAGYIKQNRDGETVVDDDAMKAKVFELVVKREVTDKSNKSTNSWTPGELLAATFPGAPGTDPKTIDMLDYAQTEVRKTLTRRVWNLTNPARTGYIQKRLVEKGSLVLCRSKVMRGLDEVNGVYVTNDTTLILSDSLGPRIEALVNEANNLRAHAAMITERHPEIEQRVLQAIGSGVKRTQAALPKATGNGRVPQSGSQGTIAGLDEEAGS